MKRLLTILILLLAAGCDDAADDRLIGTWTLAGTDGSQRTVFHNDGSVLHVTSGGDSLRGYYTFVNRNTIKLDLIDDGDSLAYLWQLDFQGDSLVVGLPSNESVVLTRGE